MVMAQRAVSRLFQLFTLQQFHAANTGRRPQMVHDRKRFVKTFGRNDVLIKDAFVFVARSRAVAVKPDVMLSRHLAKSLVIRHGLSTSCYRLPRAACSRS